MVVPSQKVIRQVFGEGGQVYPGGGTRAATRASIRRSAATSSAGWRAMSGRDSWDAGSGADGAEAHRR